MSTRSVSQIQQKLTAPFLMLLSLPSTAMGFALCVQISALSWILSTKYQLNIEEVGFVWASGPIAGIIGQLLVGFVSDRVWFLGGRRRPFIIVGGALAALMLFCLPYLDVISAALGLEDIMLVALVVALTLDLAINVSFNPTRSIIADVTPEGDKRTQGYTWMQTVSGAFGVGAYLVGAWLGNYTLIYLGVVVVLLFSILPVFFITEPRHLTDPAPEQPIEPGNTRTNLRQLIAIYGAHAFTWLGVQTMFVYLYAYVGQQMEVQEADHLGTVIGIAFAVMNSVGFLLPATVLNPLSGLIGRVRTHTLCIGVMAASYFLVLLVGKSEILLYVVMAMIGIGWAAVVSLPFAIMSEYVNKEKMGLFMGIFNLSIVIPQLIVSVVFGKIFKEAASLDIIFVICGVSLAISAVLWGFFVKDKKETAPTAA